MCVGMVVKVLSCGGDCGKTVELVKYKEVKVEMVVQQLSCGGHYGETVDYVE